MPGTSETIQIDAPIDVVYAVITDYASYPEFLDQVGTVTVKESSETSALVTYSVELLGKSIHYTLALKQQAPSRVTWSLDSSNVMKRSDGSWELSTNASGGTTAVYSVDVKPKGLVPGPIVKSLTNRALPATLAAFKARAESKVQ